MGRTMGHLGPFCPPRTPFWAENVIWLYLGLRDSNHNGALKHKYHHHLGYGVFLGRSGRAPCFEP